MINRFSVLASIVLGFVLLSSTFIGMTTSSATYNPVSDVDKDWDVDIFDIVKVAGAYGSKYTFVTPEANETIITVLSLGESPPEVGNARVTVIDPAFSAGWDAVVVDYTDLSGIVRFELSPNKNYTAIAWSGSAYNYVNFTTNLLGEASVLILLGEMPTPVIRQLPTGWVVVTLMNETGFVSPVDEFGLIVQRLELDPLTHNWLYMEEICSGTTSKGVLALRTSLPVNVPHSNRGIFLIDQYGNHRGSCVYTPDENNCANIILFVTPPP